MSVAYNSRYSPFWARSLGVVSVSFRYISTILFRFYSLPCVNQATGKAHYWLVTVMLNCFHIQLVFSNFRVSRMLFVVRHNYVLDFSVYNVAFLKLLKKICLARNNCTQWMCVVFMLVNITSSITDLLHTMGTQRR